MLIGTIVKTVGLKGEMKVNPFSDDLKNLLKLKKVFIDDIEYKIISSRIAGNMWVISLNKIFSVEDAENFCGFEIYIERSDAKSLSEYEYYIADMKNCDVIIDGKNIGKVVNIDSFGAADVYTVKGIEKMIMFPFLKKLIISVDLETKKITLDKQVFDEVAVYED